LLQKLLILFKLGYPGFWRKENNLIEKIIILFLLPFSLVYFLIFKIVKKIKKTNKVGIPVICVGNINVGGSGKTPFVIYLVNLLKKKKVSVHIVSRGYLGKLRGPIQVDIKKHTYKDVGDEALLLAKETNTWVSKNKFEGALMATLHGADVIILDDGLQNYSLHQDLKIVVVDGGFGFGNEFPLPAGPLRESISSGIKKSDILILFNKDKNDIEKKIKNKISIIHGSAKIKKISNLKNKKIVGFSGMGRPEKFYSSLKKKKINVLEFFSYPDHYSYSKKRINNLINYAKKNDAILVSTLKDKQRINFDQRKKISFLDLEIEIKEIKSLIHFLKKKKIV
jgi:tetraacyldisaccharide 4'-kinase